jgi:hypothetical protein
MTCRPREAAPQHAFHHWPAAQRLFQFAADSVARVQELAQVSALLRECAVTLVNDPAHVCTFLRAQIETMAGECVTQRLKVLAGEARAAAASAIAWHSASAQPRGVAQSRACVDALQRQVAALRAALDGAENVVALQHPLDIARVALRVCRYAADSVPRVLDLAHVNACLRECADEFGSADATLPGLLRCDYAVGRFFALHDVLKRNGAHCPWLAEKCRSGAPMPAAALAPDVTRHDVDWSATGARRHPALQLTHRGYGLTLPHPAPGVPSSCWVWAQGAMSVSHGKHFFGAIASGTAADHFKIGWVGSALDAHGSLRNSGAPPTGQVIELSGATALRPGTAPLARCQSIIGCLLDCDVGAMTVYVDGTPLLLMRSQQCNFPTGHAWMPTVALGRDVNSFLLFSQSV